MGCCLNGVLSLTSLPSRSTLPGTALPMAGAVSTSSEVVVSVGLAWKNSLSCATSQASRLTSAPMKSSDRAASGLQRESDETIFIGAQNLDMSFAQPL